MHIQCSKKGPGPEFPPNVTNPTFFIPVYYHQSSQINLTHINRKKVFLQVSGRKVSFFEHCRYNYHNNGSYTKFQILTTRMDFPWYFVSILKNWKTFFLDTFLLFPHFYEHVFHALSEKNVIIMWTLHKQWALAFFRWTWGGKLASNSVWQLYRSIWPVWLTLNNRQWTQGLANTVQFQPAQPEMNFYYRNNKPWWLP